MNKKYISILLALSIIITLFMPVSAELENITDMDLKDSTQTQNDDGLFDGTEIGFEEDEIIVDKKVYCNRTIEDDFDDKTVLLVFNKEKSIDKDVFTPEDFPEIDCISVEDLSAPTKELIDKQRNAMQRTNTSAAKLKEQSKNNDTWEKQKKTIPDELLDCDGGGLYLVNPENFRRILKITLREPGKENVLKAVKELEKRDDVIGADPNGYTKIMATTPNDNLFGYSQEVEADSIGLRDAWDKTTGSGSVTVAVIDSGIYMAHEDIQTRVSTTLGKNFADDCFCSLNRDACCGNNWRNRKQYYRHFGGLLECQSCFL